MKNHEQFESFLSTWLDGQLEHREQIELLDHLVGCESCRRFHVEARQLDGLIASVRPAADADVPPPEVWERIERAGVGEEQTRFSRVPPWVGRAAAVFLLVAGLGILAWQGPLGTVAIPVNAEIRLGGAAGRMTETRFVELIREVLGAEPRYRTALYEIMGQVMRETMEREASSEGLVPRENEEESWPVTTDVENQIPA